MKKNILISSIFFSLANIAQAGVASVDESPTNIRFEQYTGAQGNIVFWRLPYAGTSIFPGTSCLAVTIPGDKPEHASRFMALYLFAKNSNKNIFYNIDLDTCKIVSFGMNG